MRKTILITGAGRGIGAALARKAARAGYAVAINFQRDRDSAEKVVRDIQDAGGKALCVQADVGNADAVADMFRSVEATFGPLFGLVNNAGITGRLGTFEQTSAGVIEEIMRINVLGTMHCSRAALASFRQSGTRGVIVNISSVASSTGSPGEYVHYAASKAAVEAFTVGLGRELAQEGIRVCGVAPGSTYTDIHASAGEPDRPLRVAPKIPMGRLAQPEEIAEPVIWLLSPAASYVTATTLRCTGGV